ncbi:MAG: DUF3160 domain-containing protein [Candidatus Brocadiia bacterium]
MIRKIRRALLAIATLVILAIAGLQMSSGEDAVNKMRSLPFAKFYEPVKYEVNPKTVHQLPAKLDSVEGSPALKGLGISAGDKSLASNGFVLSDAITDDVLPDFYRQAAQLGASTLITTDSMLHVHHALFDDVLAQIEVPTFARCLASSLNTLRANFAASDDKTPEGSSSLLAYRYLSVALALLSIDTTSADPVVQAELDLIRQHAGFAPSPIFSYKEDYSQYVPRGHYTRTEGLSCYFRTMMWLGRLTFLAHGKLTDSDDALVDIPTAKKQILAALMIASQLEKSKFRPQFDAICEATAFFVGYCDDLSPYDYLAIARKVVRNDRFSDILDQPVYLKFLQEVLRATPPTIYSGTGEYVNPEPALNGDPQPEALAKALSATTGMRLMGQRFVPDAYIHGRLVYPTIGSYTGTGDPSTGTPSRFLPSSLDIMRILGSGEAAVIEKDLTLDAYKGFDEEITRLTKEFTGLSRDNWHANLYLGWLNSLSSLFPAKPEAGYQPFQKSNNWHRHQLNSALGSWTALRHDTILYVKQPATITGSAAPPREVKPPSVYVEPEPELYARLIALNRQMSKGLTALSIFKPDDASQYQVKVFTELLQTLLDVSIRELEGRPTTEEQQEQLLAIPHTLDWIGRSLTSIVSDVYTDQNTGKVLEVATGPMVALVVLWIKDDGTLDVAVGPNYSWYEFTRPLSDRLSDEQWRRLLRGRTPKLPVWMEPLYAPR